MGKKIRQLLSGILITLLMLSSIFETLVVSAENGEEIDGMANDTEEPIDGIDTDLEVEEVELSERKDYSKEDVEHALKDMELMAENSYLELFVHPATTEIAVRVKETQNVWFSNPVDRESDTVPTGENRAVLNSQISLTYFHLTGQTSRMHNFDSVKNGQFEIEEKNNGFQIVYTLGDTSKGIEMIPKRITKNRFEELILNKIDDESIKKDLLSRFEYVEEEDAYYPREVSFTSKIALDRTLKLFEEVGYTEEDLAVDNAEADEADGEVDAGKPRFTIPVEYTLDEDNLVVSINGEEIIENESFPIRDLKILEFFGAANEHREGYSFVPDGSGALIHLNNEKVNYQPYIQRVYGKDGASIVREQREVSENIRLPIYGMKHEDKAFLAIIEEGDAIASIEADIAGRLNSYNKVNNVFHFKEHGQITLTGGERASTITMFQKESYTKNIQIRYAFLDKDEANYTQMAKYYQNYLANNGVITPLEPSEKIPFYLELVGTILKRKTFLGIPYQSVQPLTTFEEAEKILSKLLDEDVTNIKLRYSGWFNDSYKHKIPNKVKVDSKIGGKKGLEKLNEFLVENDIDLFPDVAFLNVNRNSFGFNSAKHASRLVNKRAATKYPFNPASFRMDRSKIPYYILSPTKLPEYVKGFMKDYDRLEIMGLSLRDMGSELHSDFREKKVVNREEAKEIVLDQLASLEDNFGDVLVEGGNAYSLPHVRHIVNLPSASSEYNITDKSIPFYQIVLHGYMDYSTIPVNLSGHYNPNYPLLKSLETGSNIYFKWFYKDNALIKETEFNDLISANYDIWFDEAVQMYKEVNDLLSDVRTETIIDHQELLDNVYQTTYSNGDQFIVNYNNEDIQINQLTIDAEGYVIIEGGAANVSEK